MIGLGIDIVSLERIASLIEKYGRRFEEKILAPHEEAATSESLAGLWAAKEAVAKAIGTGYCGFGPTSIAIIKDSHGTPRAVLYGGAKATAETRGIEHILVSISHSAGVAVASAVAMGHKGN
ncbi:MAG: holo-ACP synthase [bacterium]|nr:holo-ACP synthase [bacterium]